MRLALRELRRTPGRFLVATITISLIAVLLMFLGALLDGLIQLSTGSIQAQRGQVIVMSSDSRGVLNASSVTADERQAVTEAVEETADGTDPVVGGYGEVTVGARLAGGDERELTSVRARGYEIAPTGLPATPPAAGEAWADPDLVSDYAVGDVLQLGPGRVEVQIVGFLDRSETPSLGGVWGSLDTWRDVLVGSRPGSTVPDEFIQGLVVDLGPAAEDALPSATTSIEDAGLAAFSLEEASQAIPGVSAQRTTFNQIIAVTTVIGLVVIALFFALLTAERVGLYGVLKAVGARSGALFAGVATQAIAICLIASLVGLAMIAGAAFAIPPGSLPFAVTPARIAISVGLLLTAAIIGSVFSLRTVLRIDPAQAIGGS